MTTANFWESVSWSIQTTWIASMTTTVPFSKYPLSIEVLIFQCDYNHYLRVFTHQKNRTWLHDYSQYFHTSIRILNSRDLTTWLQPKFSCINQNLRFKRPDYMPTSNFWESLLCQNSKPDYMTTAYFFGHLSKFEILETWLRDYCRFLRECVLINPIF